MRGRAPRGRPRASPRGREVRAGRRRRSRAPRARRRAPDGRRCRPRSRRSADRRPSPAPQPMRTVTGPSSGDDCRSSRPRLADGPIRKRPIRRAACSRIFGPDGGRQDRRGARASPSGCAPGTCPVAVSADALQVYSGLEILTGVAGAAERARLEHRLVSFLPVDATFSVGQYAELAHAEIDGLLAAGATPIVVGGTGLYLRAALAELELGPGRRRRSARVGGRAGGRRPRAPARAARARALGRDRIEPTTVTGSCARSPCSTWGSWSRRTGPAACGRPRRGARRGCRADPRPRGAVRADRRTRASDGRGGRGDRGPRGPAARGRRRRRARRSASRSSSRATSRGCSAARETTPSAS